VRSARCCTHRRAGRATVRAGGTRLVHDRGERKRSANRIPRRQLSREHDVTFVPFYLEGVAGIASLNIADGIHPNAEGSRIVEKTIWSALEPLLAKRTAGGKNPAR